MKLFIAYFTVVAVASAARFVKPIDSAAAELEAIIAAIQSPNTDPATAALLEQQLEAILAGSKPELIDVGPAIVDGYEPISVGPAIVDNYEPISVGPAIVDGYEPISVGPAIVDGYEPISVGPAIVDGAIVPEPAQVGPSSSPLVQIIVNVQSDFAVAGNPVVVEESPKPVPGPSIVPDPVIVVPMPVPEPAVVPEPVIVVPVPLPEIEPEPVIVAPSPAEPEVVPEPSPIIPAPVVIAPETLN